ncbi:MAG TPA: type I methionyl aminopeptidase [Clostridiales bacterium]|nr:MAG: Methionine aminopeptidase 1 [Firmicutes bacterium ADurb.Bin262]HOU09715.1 type I methionyl aminopeptidase [Clostridiales bacterium]HQK72506.1 type I methionyl aminopeptidase [Clostridiales bacterium]
MIVLKTAKQLSLIREACAIAAGALEQAGKAVEPGVSTAEIDRIACEYIARHGAQPTFLHYEGFPAGACISVNDEVIHGIPSHKRIIGQGDLVSIDLGATLEGCIGDTAATFAAGDITPEAKRLCDTTRESLFIGIAAAVAGGRIGDISSAIQLYCESRGFSLVREYTGHGVGLKLHEEPSVPNVGKAGMGPRLVPGMTLAIEPMVNAGSSAIKRLSDGWTVKTLDGSLSAHFEHTIAITPDGPAILTAS